MEEQAPAVGYMEEQHGTGPSPASTRLRIAHNFAGGDAASRAELAQTLRDRNGLEALDLTGCQLGGFDGIISALASHSHTLTSLVLSGNGFVGATPINALVGLSLFSLTSIDLSWNRIGDEGVQALTSHAQAAALVSLDLSGNCVSDIGALAIAELLHTTNNALTALNVSNNAVSDAGVEHLASAVAQGGGVLLSLDLSSNALTDAGVDALASAVTQGGNLRELYVLFNASVTDEALHRLKTACNARRSSLASDLALSSVASDAAEPWSPSKPKRDRFIFAAAAVPLRGVREVEENRAQRYEHLRDEIETLKRDLQEQAAAHAAQAAALESERTAALTRATAQHAAERESLTARFDALASVRAAERDVSVAALRETHRCALDALASRKEAALREVARLREHSSASAASTEKQHQAQLGSLRELLEQKVSAAEVEQRAVVADLIAEDEARLRGALQSQRQAHHDEVRSLVEEKEVVQEEYAVVQAVNAAAVQQHHAARERAIAQVSAEVESEHRALVAAALTAKAAAEQQARQDAAATLALTTQLSESSGREAILRQRLSSSQAQQAELAAENIRLQAQLVVTARRLSAGTHSDSDATDIAALLVRVEESSKAGSETAAAVVVSGSKPHDVDPLDALQQRLLSMEQSLVDALGNE